MAVVLSGVGADTTNARPTPPRYDDGVFEYVPIPERARDETVETTTYGDWSLRRGGTAADLLDEVRPRGDGSLVVDGDALAGWPLHHDPNFEALTYGERRPAYVKRLRRLGEGDAVGFYTGLDDGGGALHRYLVGYLEVSDVTYVAGMDPADAAAALRATPDNAHAKRFEASGEVDSNLVVVDGRDGGLLDRATRISTRTPSGHYYLRDELQSAWRPEPSGRDGRNAYLGGVKQAHYLEVAAGQLLDDLPS